LNFFFDRNLGTAIPQALLHLRVPAGIHYHRQYFRDTALDDEWLPIVGQNGWIVITQDTKFYLLPNELDALKRYSIGCFYLGTAAATRWTTFRLLARSYDRIGDIVASTPTPFIYAIRPDGRVTRVNI
jgi:hypothetical protein